MLGTLWRGKRGFFVQGTMRLAGGEYTGGKLGVVGCGERFWGLTRPAALEGTFTLLKCQIDQNL
jgi:hypothetical protein